ncbi:hypothetical protein CHU98_g8267 [Xylaria longipes]|nr:hypothetical protein CHU98_g8267 [Xylaria longipes]
MAPKQNRRRHSKIRDDASDDEVEVTGASTIPPPDQQILDQIRAPFRQNGWVLKPSGTDRLNLALHNRNVASPQLPYDNTSNNYLESERSKLVLFHANRGIVSDQPTRSAREVDKPNSKTARARHVVGGRRTCGHYNGRTIRSEEL